MNRIYMILCCAIITNIADTSKVQVTLKQGTVIGAREETIFQKQLHYVFYGVPYAQPPLGKLRFKDPEPIKPSGKPFNAGAGHRITCAQTHIAYKKKYGVENCLFLNIYTQQLKQARPVVVWFHGYGFTSSFSHIHSGDFLIEQDVVFISVTYRLGVFGYLKVNDTAGDANMGLKDMVQALKWIKHNVNHFGGDKNQVTVMGSGSAASCLSLLLLTKARRLFSNMILHSGSMFSPSLFQGDFYRENTAVTQKIEKTFGKKINKVLANDIIASSHKIYSTIDLLNTQRPLVPFTPSIEKKSNSSLLHIKPDDYIRKHGRLKINLPILIGFDTQESLSEVIPFISNPYYLLSFKPYFKFMVPFSDGCRYKYTSKIYESIANEIKDFYFKEGISEKSVQEFVKYTSDLQKYPIYKFIKTLVATESNVFVFKFNYKGSYNAMKSNSVRSTKWKLRGTASGDELCYLLRCEPYLENYLKDMNNTRDKEVIERLSKMWANFAKHGNPTPTNTYNEPWPPMTSENDRILLIAAQNEIINADVEEKMYKFWNDLYKKYYAEENCVNVKDEL